MFNSDRKRLCTLVLLRATLPMTADISRFTGTSPRETKGPRARKKPGEACAGKVYALATVGDFHLRNRFGSGILSLGQLSQTARSGQGRDHPFQICILGLTQNPESRLASPESRTRSLVEVTQLGLIPPSILR